jgi:multidrug efflux system membrane fusion protein
MPDAVSDRIPAAFQRRWWWLLVLVVAAVAWWFWPRGGTGPGGAGRAGMGAFNLPVPVRVEAIEQKTVNHVLRAIGTVTAFNTVTVQSRVDGPLEQVLFSEGQKVKAGDVLARIDPKPFQASLDRASGQLQQNQAQLKNAQRDLARYQTLYKQNSLARQQLDTQLALVQQLQGQVQSAQADVDDARLQLGYTRITAPIDGRLGLRKVDVGNMVRASDTNGVVVITQTQPIAVRFSLPQTDLPDVLARLHQNPPLPVELYDRGDTRTLATGTLLAVDNQIDVATGTVALKAQVPNQDETLFPNQFVNVRMTVASAQAPVVPTAAVQQGSIGTFVYKLKDDRTVTLQVIQTGWVDGRYTQVLKGLNEGDRVVVDGADRLREGATISIVAPGLGDAPAASLPGKAAGTAPPGQAPAAGAPANAGAGGSAAGGAAAPAH